MIYVTGDTHGGFDGEKLKTFNGVLGDYLIVLGDFGYYWDDSTLEQTKRKWLNERDYTILFVDGNHENFNMLSQFHVVEMFGSIVGQWKNDKIFHLKRGHIYNIENKTFFVMGGAYSIDKGNRKENISWWKEEIPNCAEFELGISNLEKVEYKVDYILSHTGPKIILNEYIKQYSYEIKSDRTVETYLEMIVGMCYFNHHYFGHWHDDWDFGKYSIVYDRIIELN